MSSNGALVTMFRVQANNTNYIAAINHLREEGGGKWGEGWRWAGGGRRGEGKGDCPGILGGGASIIIHMPENGVTSLLSRAYRCVVLCVCMCCLLPALKSLYCFLSLFLFSLIAFSYYWKCIIPMTDPSCPSIGWLVDRSVKVVQVCQNSAGMFCQNGAGSGIFL